MKSIVLYYSATGNTRKIAKAIHQGMKQSLEDCDIATIKEVAPRDLVKYDLIGLGGPIWGGREPANVQIYLRNLPDLKGKLAFPFCNHGSYPDGFMYWVVPALQKKGLTIIGYNDWYGGCHQLPYILTVHPCDGHPDEVDLQEAEDFGREIVKRSRRISVGETNLIPPDPAKFSLPDYVHCDFADTFKWRKLAKLNMEKCLYPACRLCMDNCPLDGIDLSVDPPIFAKPCTDCHFCGQICPTGAIEIDYDRIEAANKLATGRIKEVFVPRVLEAAAQGHLRMLVSPEDVGWDTPLYKVYNKNPRWIIGKGRRVKSLSGDA